MTDDTTLLCRYAETRAEDAFAELVRRHLDVVYAGALRRVGGDTHLAEDVAQQVFVALARRAEALVEHPALTSWLHVATRNEAANVVRAERRRKAREQEAEAMQRLNATDSGNADWSRVMPVLDDAIDELNEPDRAAVLLRFMQRKAFADIGRALRVSEDAARMRVDRALEKLKVLLARRGVSSTSAALGIALTTHAVTAAPASLAANVLGAATLAGAATPAGAIAAATWLSALSFMSTTKWIAGIAGALAISATIGTAGLQWRLKSDAEQALRAAERLHAMRLAEWEETRRRADAAERARVEAEQRLAVARAEQDRLASAARLAPAEAAEPWNPVAKGQEYLRRHPKVKAALNDYVRANLKFRYGILYRELNLRPEQTERFAEIWGGGMGMGAMTLDGDVSLRLREQTDGSNPSEQLRELIGEEGMQKLNAGNLTRQARELAAEVASSLYFTDTPLTPQQAGELTSIVATSRKPIAGSLRTERDWDMIFAKAADVLSPPQMEVLAGTRAGELFHQALNRPRTKKADLPPAKGAGL